MQRAVPARYDQALVQSSQAPLAGDLTGLAPAPPSRQWRIAGIAALAVIATVVFVFKVSGTMPDFEVYWRAAVRASAAEPLYRPEDGHWQFKYLPGFAVLAAPLGAMALPTVSGLWFGLSVFLLVSLLRLSVTLLPEQRKTTAALVTVTVVAMGKFYARELGLGQVNLLFAVTVAGAVLAMRRHREGLAGVLIAASLLLKPYGVILLPWLVARGRLRALGAAALGLIVVLILPVPLYGIDGTIELHRAWWHTVVSTTAPNLVTPENVSWLAMYTRWFGEGRWPAVFTVATMASAGGLGLWVWRTRRHVAFPEGLEAGLLLLLIPFVSPQGWDYVLLVGTPAIVLFANDLDLLPRWLAWAALIALCAVGLAIYDVMSRPGYLWFHNMSAVAVCYLLVMGALVVLRIRRVA